VERSAVRSTDIAIVGYEKDTQTLEIAFRSGHIYRYRDVPEAIYESLMKSESHGSYFRDHIREKFACDKIN